VLLSLWGLSWAASQGLMTRNVGPSEQGRLQGLDGGLRGIADLVGPGLFTLTFAHFIRAQGNGDRPARRSCSRPVFRSPRSRSRGG